jgi:hypothetical protein
MNKEKARIIEELADAIEARKAGLKPMRPQVFYPGYGANGDQWEYDGKFYDTLEEFKEALNSYKVIGDRPNVFMIPTNRASS